MAFTAFYATRRATTRPRDRKRHREPQRGRKRHNRERATHGRKDHKCRYALKMRLNAPNRRFCLYPYKYPTHTRKASRKAAGQRKTTRKTNAPNRPPDHTPSGHRKMRPTISSGDFSNGGIVLYRLSVKFWPREISYIGTPSNFAYIAFSSDFRQSKTALKTRAVCQSIFD